METHHYSCIKLITISLPLFCILSLSFNPAGADADADADFITPQSSAVLAAAALRNRGYSIFASILTTATNFSGTVLAPPDFAFSFAAAKFLNHRRPPPRPSISFLLYHTVKPPLILTWPSHADGDEFPTLHNNNCLFVFRNSYGGDVVSISPSPYKNPISAVKIRQPALYVDEHLTVHGIDGVLDPIFATKCSHLDPTVETSQRHVNRTFLDHAMKGLRRSGFNVVAAAMAIRRSELLSLTSVTIFAVSDENLFMKSGGFRYDFRHHVVPMRHRLKVLAKFTDGGLELNTLASEKPVVVDSLNGAVSVDGVAVEGKEVYHNRWIVVIAVASSLDDVVRSQMADDFPDSVDADSSSSPITGASTEHNLPISDTNPTENPPSGTVVDGGDDFPSLAPATSPNDFGSSTGSPSPAVSPAADTDSHCDISDAVSIGVEGGDLFCPVKNGRELLETESLNVEGSKPLDANDQVSDDLTVSEKVKIDKNVNIADDLFFYI